MFIYFVDKFTKNLAQSLKNVMGTIEPNHKFYINFNAILLKWSRLLTFKKDKQHQVRNIAGQNLMFMAMC